MFVGHGMGVSDGNIFVIEGGALVGGLVGDSAGIAVGPNDPLQIPQVTLQYAGINTGRSGSVEWQ